MTGSWSKDRQAIVQQIREKWEQSQFSEEEIFRVEGILDVNTLELLDFDNEVKRVIEQSDDRIKSYLSKGQNLFLCQKSEGILHLLFAGI